QQDYANPSAWKRVNLDSTPLEVKAYIADSSVHADAALKLTATGEQAINAVVVAGSVAVSGGAGLGVGLSAAGAATHNRIATQVNAFINGDGATGIEATTVSLTAKDISHINAVTAAASLAAALTGGVSVAVSIGVSLATNVVNNSVEAYIANADQGVK